ncbi:hypothetical protein SAMN05421810_107222 [Amycolatopsis arida]|uniref:4-amino-4-deoxy-L-arabinose transferase n=1 Tax=Amycolatopsis arida TaxID=587909 RepID=A0A1I5YK61_9PSEU|nr:DUF6541 family protein [Amycolatopsis arida]TDX90575.1 hypothetical protein CLV69_107222 [Amycolatopsis arida]SFQ44578.1 hypothetical protein SAMN05421810_107222 [Amycolatopsis arida]
MSLSWFFPFVAFLVLVGPGLVIQLAAGVRDTLWLVALSVPVSFGVLAVAGVVSAVPGLPMSPVLVAGATVVLAVGLALLTRMPRDRPAAATSEPAPPGFLPALSPRLTSLATAAAVVLCLGAVLLALVPWWYALRGWSTYPQEHDPVVHTLLAGYIARTGEAAPWKLMPVDLLTGQPVSFYPSGLPLAAAVTGAVTGGPIVGFNLVTALVLGPVFVLTVAALAAAMFRRFAAGPGWTALAGGVAAVVAAGLYRPATQLMHDGGVAPNAVALSLAPGLIAAMMIVDRGQWPRVALLGLGLAGGFAVHPSIAATVGASMVVVWLVDACTAAGRRRLRQQWVAVVAAGGVAALAGVGTLLGSLSQAARTGGWAVSSNGQSVGDAVGSNLVLVYGGFVDGDERLAQVATAVVALAGVAVVLLTRRGWAALAPWAFWLLVTVERRVAPDGVAANTIGTFFYKSYPRIQSHLSLFVPVLAALGILGVAVGAARLLRSWRPVRARGSSAGTSAALVAVVLTGYVVTAAVPYAERNAATLATRYTEPEFTRVTDDDRRAADWLATHVRPGERVMNSANDGSTYAYITRGVPLVVVSTLGSAEAPYTYELLRSFDEYPRDPRIRRLIQSLNIAYVYVDTAPPRIGAGPGAPNNWLGEPTMTVPPGLSDVEGLPGAEPAFRSGPVTVYRLDRAAVAALDGHAG